MYTYIRWTSIKQQVYKYLTLPYCLCYIGLNVHSQEQVLHTNRNFPLDLPLYTSTDSINISKWVQEGRRLEYIQTDSALFLLYKAYRHAQYKRYNYGAAVALNFIGKIHFEQGQLDSALYLFNYGLQYYYKGHYRDTIQMLLLGSIGSIYLHRGEYLQAITYSDSALAIGRKLNAGKQIIAAEIINKSKIYLRLNQPQKALLYLEEAETICRQENYPLQLILTLNNKAYAYGKLNQIDKAKATLREQLKVAQKANGTMGLIITYAALGIFALQDGQPKEAIDYLEKAVHKMDVRNPFHYPIGIRRALGEAYFISKQYKQAEQQLKIVLEETINQNIKDELPAIHNTLADIYEITGRYKEALLHQKEYEQLKDSIFNREKVKDINELEVKYSSAEKDRKLLEERARVLENEVKLRGKNFWIAAITLSAVFMAALFIVIYRNINHRQKLALREEELKRLQALIEGEEKERSRIARELHDGIGGILVAINMNLGVIKKEHPEAGLLKVEQMVDEAGLEIRKTARNLMPDMLERHNLKEALLLYCEKINEGNHVQVQLQFDEELRIESKVIELILYRIIQELVQNIVRHAQAAHAGIHIMQYERKLVITVEDDGKGFDTTATSSGLGLSNIQYRVNTLHGKIQIESAKEIGTTVHIEFELDDLILKQSTG